MLLIQEIKSKRKENPDESSNFFSSFPLHIYII